MLIWFNLLIPLIAVLVMLFMFRKKMAWWEYIIVVAIPLIAITAAHFISVKSQTFDKEFWNAYLIRAEYEEPWSTWDEEECTREDCTTDSDGDETCVTVTYDCSHCDATGPIWTAYDNLGRSHSIDEGMFNYLCTLWGNKVKVEMNRSINYHGSCGQDGEMFVTEWNSKFDCIQTYCDVHNYENKVQASRSVFNFQKIDTSDINFYGLFKYQYSFDNYNYNPILGVTAPKASERLQRWNALLGASKKIHMMILVFHNKTIDAAMKQESYWKGGNKNEFILCIGVNDSNKIQWTKVISWTEVDKLKFEVEKSVVNMPFNLSAISDTMASYTKREFIKKSFKDFNYLSVEPSPRAITICFFITILLTVGVCIFSCNNPFTEDEPNGDDNSFYRRRY